MKDLPDDLTVQGGNSFVIVIVVVCVLLLLFACENQNQYPPLAEGYKYYKVDCKGPQGRYITSTKIVEDSLEKYIRWDGKEISVHKVSESTWEVYRNRDGILLGTVSIFEPDAPKTIVKTVDPVGPKEPSKPKITFVSKKEHKSEPIKITIEYLYLLLLIPFFFIGIKISKRLDSRRLDDECDETYYSDHQNIH